MDGEDVEAPQHICQCLGKVLAARGGGTFAVSGERRTTGEGFVRGVIGLAAELSGLGVARGDVVAIASLNSEWYVEWLLAVAFVGGIAAPLNHRWSLEEAKAAVEVVRPVLLVVDKSCYPWVKGLQDVSSIKHHLLIGEDSPITFISVSGSAKGVNVMDVTTSCHVGGAIVGNALMDWRKVANDCPNKITTREPALFAYSWAPNDVALICFTSGTTGRPRGVALSHTSLIVQAIAKNTIVGYSAEDVYLHTAPLCHVGGISSCIAVLFAGGQHVFIPKFDAKAAARAILHHHVTSLITVPAMMADMISSTRGQTGNRGAESVKKVLNGGGSLPAELVNSAIDIFPHAKLISAYGMTEACSSLTFFVLHDPISKNFGYVHRNNYDGVYDQVRHLGGTCVGRPPSHVELQIQSYGRDDSMLNVGTILTKGTHVMVGYWDHSPAIKTIIGPDDWLDTGDLGWIDTDGDLWLLGRKKYNIRTGGESVYPEEVEPVLCQHPGVSSALVFGIPNTRLSEMVVACICPKENWEWINQNNACSSEFRKLSGEILLNHCKVKNLTRFKIPKLYIPWRKPFPRTTTGKLKREEVRKEVLSYMQFLCSNL